MHSPHFESATETNDSSKETLTFQVVVAIAQLKMSFVKAFMVTCLVLISLMSSAMGHGRLMDPPSRGSMWRMGFKTPKNYNDNQLYCGGFTVRIHICIYLYCVFMCHVGCQVWNYPNNNQFTIAYLFISPWRELSLFANCTLSKSRL